MCFIYSYDTHLSLLKCFFFKKHLHFSTKSHKSKSGGKGQRKRTKFCNLFPRNMFSLPYFASNCPPSRRAKSKLIKIVIKHGQGQERKKNFAVKILVFLLFLFPRSASVQDSWIFFLVPLALTQMTHGKTIWLKEQKKQRKAVKSIEKSVTRLMKGFSGENSSFRKWNIILC